MGCAQGKESQCTESKSVNRVSLIKQEPKPRIRQRRTQITEEDVNNISASFSESSLREYEPSISVVPASAEEGAEGRQVSVCSTSATSESSLYPKRRLRRRRSQDTTGTATTRSPGSSTGSDVAGSTLLPNPLSGSGFTLFSPLGASQGERPVNPTRSPLSFNTSNVSPPEHPSVHLEESREGENRSDERPGGDIDGDHPLPMIVQDNDSENVRDRRTSSDAPPELNNTASYVEVGTTGVLGLGPLLVTLDSPDSQSIDPEDCVAVHSGLPRCSVATTMTHRSNSTTPQSSVPEFDDSTSASQGKLSPEVLALFQPVVKQDDQEQKKGRPVRRKTVSSCCPLVLDPHAATKPKIIPSELRTNSLSPSQSPASSVLSTSFTLSGGMEFVLAK